MAVKQLYPNQRPTLNLNFARSKTLDPRITFTRNSTATYVGSDGLIKTAAAGEARFDHDPVTGECHGLLIEGGRSNLATNSTMESSDWQDFQSYQSDAIIISSNNAAPDGTNTAVLMGEQRTGNWNKSCYLRQNLTVNTAGDYVISVFAKRSASSATDTVTIGLSGFTDSTPAGAVRFRIDTLEWSAADTTASYADRLLPVEDYGNGWYRISVKWTLASTGLTGGIMIGIAKSSISGGAGYRINRNDDNWGYFWGAQVEESSYLTSYIPSAVGSTGSRVQEDVSITGTNFSDFWNASEGTVVTTVYPFKKGRIWAIWGGQNKRFTYSNNNNSSLFDNYFISNEHGTTYTAALFGTSGVDVENVEAKNAFAFSLNDSRAAHNGVLTVAIQPPSMPTVHTWNFFKNYANSKLGAGYLKKIAYYPTRLSDSQLQELTS